MKQSFLKIIRWDRFKMYCNSTICRSCTIETCPRWEDLKNFYTKEMREQHKKELQNPISSVCAFNKGVNNGRTFRTEAFEEKH
jgi:hypothetical protein